MVTSRDATRSGAATTSRGTDGTVIQVALPTPLRRTFDYLFPRDSAAPAPRPGCRVRVPFGRTHLVGVVVDVAATARVDRSRLKPVAAVLDAEPLLDDSVLSLLRWASTYFQHPIGEVVVGTLPRMLRIGRAAHIEREFDLEVTVAGSVEQLARAPRQVALFERIAAAGQLPEADLDRGDDGLRRALKALLEKGFVERVPREDDAPVEPTPGPPLNPDQRAAVDTVAEAMSRYEAFVLDGVTGSGKTEVYLNLIEKVVAQGRQALVLIPEIGLTPQILGRFRDRFAVEMAVLHSGLSDGDRARAWLRARDGSAPIVIGTRSAVFVPLASPGLFIVDEEHDLSYKQQDGFRYSARDLAVLRARRASVPIVLGSATPSIEALFNVSRERYRCLHLPVRAGGAESPRIDVVDLRSRKFDEGFSDELTGALETCLANNEQALLFINRRGYAPILICRACGWTAECERCDARMVFHREEGRLRCHHCGANRAPDPVCPACAGADLRPLGLGTQRVVDTLRERFPDARVERLDRDSTRRRGELEGLLDRIHAGEVDILVGTQMLAKGHHFPGVTLVAVLDADGGLLGVDFRSTERMAQLLLQVAGRAGRGTTPGRVVVQTHHPDHPLLRTLIVDGYRRFCEIVLEERRAARLPPFTSLALLRAEAADRGAVHAFLDEALRRGRARGDGAVALLGPIPAPMERRAGKYRAQVLVEASERGPLHRFLAPWVADLEGCADARRVRWSVDVDPQEIL